MTDHRFMRRALELAKGHRTHPNPRVGSVVLSSSGEVVGEGAHVAAGKPHAEVVALNAAGNRAAGGTIYVTLEPCAHHGRTPPCTDAIIESGIAKAVVAMTDPDKRVEGEGIARLESAGIEVQQGLLGDEASALNEAYIRHRRTGLPLITAKWAMTLDGSVAATDGTSRWISSEDAREDAHALRAGVDAVVVGMGTVRSDNPRLTVRTEGYDGPQPRPVVVAGEGEIPQQAGIWERSPVVIATSEVTIPNGEVVVVDRDGANPDPTAAAEALANLGYLDILLEGGPTIAGAWWNAGVIQRGIIYLSSKLGGGSGVGPMGGVFETISDAAIVEVTGVRSLGPDVRVDFSRK